MKSLLWKSLLFLTIFGSLPSAFGNSYTVVSAEGFMERDSRDVVNLNFRLCIADEELEEPMPEQTPIELSGPEDEAKLLTTDVSGCVAWSENHYAPADMGPPSQSFEFIRKASNPDAGSVRVQFSLQPFSTADRPKILGLKEDLFEPTVRIELPISGGSFR